MAQVIGIMGESGSGKTTSLRNLPPKETYYIDCDKKGLSWKGWKSGFNADKAKNYLRADKPALVTRALYWLNGMKFDNNNKIVKDEKSTGLPYKYLVIDTVNGMMVGEEMRRSKEKGYDKWTDIASFVYDIVDYCLDMRDDLTIILVFHSETVMDDSGYTFTRIKTNGKKLEKIKLETKLSTLLYAECIDGSYKFHTKANKSTAKTPMGLFDEDLIDNDIMEVIKALEEF